MKKIVILVICILLLTVSFSAGCIFEEEKKKSGGNEPVNTEALNITAINHEPASPTANDTVTVTVKIQAENELEPVTIIFCYEDTGICTISGVMSLKQGTEDTYEYSIEISDNYKQQDKITYHVTAMDKEGNEEEAEGKFTVQ